MNKSIHTQAIITGVRSKSDRSLGLTIATPELEIQEKAIFLELQGIPCEMIITPIDRERVEEYKINKEVEDRTPGQRLRAKFFRLWERNNEGYPVFDMYYKSKMEKLIAHYQKMLDEY